MKASNCCRVVDMRGQYSLSSAIEHREPSEDGRPSQSIALDDPASMCQTTFLFGDALARFIHLPRRHPWCLYLLIIFRRS